VTTAAELIDDLQWRGLIAQSTDLDALRDALDAGSVTFYSGIDPTAPSMHVGNLVQWLTARRLQEAGHRPLALVGGATGLVGDPSGRTAERSLNEAEVVAEWVSRIRDQVSRFIAFDGPAAAVMVNNLDWTAQLSAIEWLRDIGKHFSVNRMLDKESVSARLAGGGISYTEFSYQVMQANDYLELHRRHGCVLQTGGSDQWGNITAGVDLVRRVTGANVHALTTPLVTKADGAKFGKTASGSVWVDPEMTSPYAFYQFWLNTADADVVDRLKVFTFLTRAEIEELARSVEEEPYKRQAQKVLAWEVNSLVHGEEATEKAIAASAAVFGRGELTELDAETLDSVARELPGASVSSGALQVADLLVATGLSESKSAARRTLKEGGAYVNNEKVVGEDAELGPDQLLHGRWALLRRGKKHLAAVTVEA
jgi:tyrosyl-tRNA synthetase